MPPCIEVANLTKYYGATLALDSLSFSVETGEVFGVLGPNGSGKSSLLLMMAGLVRPTGGSIRFFGKEQRRHYLELAPRIGFTVSRPAFFEHLTTVKNLQLFSRLSRRTANIERALDLVGLGHAQERIVSDLSPASRQRFALALAFLHEPEVLVLDEPVAGLNPEQSQEMLNLLHYLAKEANVTVLLSSHMMHEVETVCDRVAVLNQGRLVSCGETDRLLSYDTSTIEVLIDHPEAAAKRLREESWVESVDVKPGRIAVKLDERDPHHLVTFLIEKGYVVSGMIPRRRTLQEYFLKVLNA